MNSISKIFAVAALAGGTLLGASAQAQQAPQQPVDPVQAFDSTPTCLSFEHTDRGGVTFPDPVLHQYDQAMKQFAEALQSYSHWDEMAARLEKLGAALNGVCVYSYGKDKPPVSYDDKMGSIDINIYSETPWGDGLKSPAQVTRSLDAMVHFATYTLNSSIAGKGMIPPILTPETSAFLRSVEMANGHAEAVLATIERGLDENRLAELEPLLFEASPMFRDQIALLYSKVSTSGELTDADRTAFKASLIKSMFENPGRRGNDFQATARLMQELAKRQVDVSKLFDLAPEEAMINAQLAARFGADVANMTIDGKSLLQAYTSFWENNPNDPAAPIKEQLEQFQAFVGQAIAQKEREEAARQQQQPAPATPQVPQPQPLPTPQ